MLALIDMDILVYSCGFASDAEAKRQGLEHEPLNYCLQIVNQLIDRIVLETQADDYKGYLTGKNNYREELAVTLPYKGNRDTSHKPYWYKEIKKYLVSHHNAEIIDGMEADDKLGIECTKDNTNTVIATIDKDLRMIEGYHYNWRKGSHVDHVTEAEGTKFFYTQLLTGDMTDNIQGIRGIGPKKAEKILAGCITERELYCAVGNAYAVAYDSPEEVMKEMADLLWIQKREGVLWQPPMKSA